MVNFRRLIAGIPILQMLNRREREADVLKVITLAEQAYSGGSNGEAVRLCERVLDQAPKLARVHFLAGCACMADRRWADAGRYFASADALEPFHEDGLAQLYQGDCAIKLGHTAIAHAHYMKVRAASTLARVRDEATRRLTQT